MHLQNLQIGTAKNRRNSSSKIAESTSPQPAQEEAPAEAKERKEKRKEKEKESVAASPRSPTGSPVVPEEGDREEQEAQPDLVTLRTEYATLSQQLEQLDAKKQAGQWARLYKQVQAAEARLRQAEQAAPPSLAEPTEHARQANAKANGRGEVPPTAKIATADERQEQLRSIAGELIYWRDGLKVLRQAQLPKWRGLFKWQIEAKIEALQTEYAKLRAEVARPDG